MTRPIRIDADAPPPVRQQRPFVPPEPVDTRYDEALARIRSDIRAGTLTELAVGRTRARYKLTENDVQRARRKMVAEGLAVIKGRRCVAKTREAVAS